MSDMVERAARAGDYEDAAQKGEPSIWSESHFPPGEEGMAELYDERRAVYRAALLAALDDEDEALLAALTEAPTFDKLDIIDAKIIIGLIKAHAQGEQ